jgi:hypothetical protein
MCVLPIKNEPGSKWIKCGDVKKKLTGEQIFEPCYIFNIEHLTKFFIKCSVFDLVTMHVVHTVHVSCIICHVHVVCVTAVYICVGGKPSWWYSTLQ